MLFASAIFLVRPKINVKANLALDETTCSASIPTYSKPAKPFVSGRAANSGDWAGIARKRLSGSAKRGAHINWNPSA